MDKKILKNLRPEDMPNDDLKFIAEVCGIETAIALLKNVPGTNIYIPSSGYSFLMEQKIKNEFNNGISPNRLAVEYGTSVQKIREILKRKDVVKVTKITKDKNGIKKQLSIFEAIEGE